MEKPQGKSRKITSVNDKKNFKVGHPKMYDGKFPNYCQPIEIGCFSTDFENKFYDDNHQMKYLSLPRKLEGLGMDLNAGYSDYVGTYNDTEDTNYKLLRWIIAHQTDLKEKFTDEVSSKPEIDFACNRSVLNAISTTIYEKYEEWQIYATKYKSIIYLFKMDTEEKLKREDSLTDREKLMGSWGYKFEQYITSDTVNSKPNTSSPVNVNEKFFVVMKGELQNHRLLFVGETDAVDPNDLSEPNSMLRYVEMKTTKIQRDDKQRYFFRLRLLKWYIQSFIAGIPRVVCGYRDEDGIVREIEIYDVSDLPKIAQHLWSPAACLNFCTSFLDYVKERVVKDDHRVVYKFYWKPCSDITCEELNSDHQLLPEWYTQKVSFI